ncbi:MAG TPA: hypothetical protein VGN72_11030 [Tepidisphaeraceae bacterium]|jgi:hypothetical protein|nr:hypothetical protein [Tepidisphaeraceae bacterium]
MSRLFQYYGQYQNVKGGVTGLPGWGRALILIAAVPGIVLIALSLLALGVSILALLVLAVPAYKLVRALTPEPRVIVEGVMVEEPSGPVRGATTYAPDVVVGDIVEETQSPRPSTGRRTIDVTIVD